MDWNINSCRPKRFEMNNSLLQEGLGEIQNNIYVRSARISNNHWISSNVQMIKKEHQRDIIKKN